MKVRANEEKTNHRHLCPRSIWHEAQLGGRPSFGKQSRRGKRTKQPFDYRATCLPRSSHRFVIRWWQVSCSSATVSRGQGVWTSEAPPRWDATSTIHVKRDQSFSVDEHWARLLHLQILQSSWKHLSIHPLSRSRSRFMKAWWHSCTLFSQTLIIAFRPCDFNLAFILTVAEFLLQLHGIQFSLQVKIWPHGPQWTLFQTKNSNNGTWRCLKSVEQFQIICLYRLPKLFSAYQLPGVTPDVLSDWVHGAKTHKSIPWRSVNVSEWKCTKKCTSKADLQEN